MIKELSEQSLVDLLEDIGASGLENITIKPVSLVVQQARVVRYAPFTWFWVCPSRPHWLHIGPFYTARGCRRAAAPLEMPTARGWIYYTDLVKAFRKPEDREIFR